MRDKRLVDAAATLLALRPNATIEDIASAAGVSRATVNRRFPTRASLISELCGVAVERWVAAVVAAQPEAGTATEALRRVLIGIAPLAPQYGLLVLQPLDEMAEAELLDRMKETSDRFVRLVRRGQAAGEFRVDLPAEWVEIAAQWLLVGAADGLRLGRLAQREVERLVVESVLGLAMAVGP